MSGVDLPKASRSGKKNTRRSLGRQRSIGVFDAGNIVGSVEALQAAQHYLTKAYGELNKQVESRPLISDSYPMAAERLNNVSYSCGVLMGWWKRVYEVVLTKIRKAASQAIDNLLHLIILALFILVLVAVFPSIIDYLRPIQSFL